MIFDRYLTRAGANVRLFTSRFETEKATENYASLSIMSINLNKPGVTIVPKGNLTLCVDI